MTPQTLAGPSRSAQRREMACVLGLGLLAAALILFAAGRSWIRVTVLRIPPFGPLQDELTGRELYPALTGLAVVALLGGALVLVTGGMVRRLLGVALVPVGGWAGGYGFRGLDGGHPSGLDQPAGATLTERSGLEQLHWHPFWPGVTVGAAMLLMLCGLLLAVRAGRWQVSLWARYAAPGVVAESTDPWRRLDRGEDPTVSDR
ncbi:MAG TPA: Trp biosynthesis-associated membrane protein [Jatrophihabitans sp.]|jgi:hypothetical protein|uniref:Trp biosynthesis-associated membrane protein n=1 Tax=Jatrophihabitans sp. TaxID=1932789 RepID=UPI002F1F9421